MSEKRKALFELRGVRKTYGLAGKVPGEVFRECRLPEHLRPSGEGWRRTCGHYRVCRQECPRCWALNIESMRIRRGRTTAILGHSGSGKTTLLYVLALLHAPDPDFGRLSLGFEEGAPRNLELGAAGWFDEGRRRVAASSVRRRRFGFVFQAGHLSSHLSAVQNVGLAPALVGRGVKEVRRLAGEILGGIDFPVDRHRALPRQLSGGEYQRVAVARALAADPDVLFADEPTGNLDPVTGRAVMELLTDWRRGAPGRSLILVTHNLEHALEFADDLFVLGGGEIALSVLGASRGAAQLRPEIEAALERRPAAEIPTDSG